MAKECICPIFVNACKTTPGIFLPEEAEKAAEEIGIPFEEFRKNLIIDYYIEPDMSHTYYWVPRKSSVDTDRKVASFSYAFAFAPCVFLQNDLCSIHKVK